MKTTYTRRYRRVQRKSKSNGSFFKKETQQEQSFFGEATNYNFFNSAAINASPLNVQRKCKECEDEDKKVHRQPEKKEEEKKLHRQVENKEEDKEKVHRMAEKKEEDKEKIHRQADPEKKEDEKVQKKENNSVSAGVNVTAGFINTLSGTGNKLSRETNNFFSKRMRFDFSGVKVHTGKEAAESAKGINAKAYTTGNNIVFNDGEYNPESSEGKKLLAHELVHVIQQDNNPGHISRKAEAAPAENMMPEKVVITSGEGPVKTSNTRDFANCEGLSVQGFTDANYSHSFTHSGSGTSSTKCASCAPPDCINNSGIIVSVFSANPVITLPTVPDGLSECETNAVENFINTTLLKHEQKHVAAFNTYAGTVKTPYTYTGCSGGLDAYIEAQHSKIEAARKSASDKKSKALDQPPFNPKIPCKCPE